MAEAGTFSKGTLSTQISILKDRTEMASIVDHDELITGAFYLLGWDFINLDTAAHFVHFFDALEGVANSNATAKLTVNVPLSGVSQIFLPKPIRFATGLSLVASDEWNGTTVVTGTDVAGTVYYEL